ncbi:MAG: endonuclease/exonuclease/phosphatase family protein [Rubrivivax sp.]|nr:endonuclease/exonuclease/phosphatase family protein [Pyrinomonadaceae bacterium]
MSNQSKSIAVLSYNICLEAMTHNADGKRTHGSAYELGNRCTGPQHGLTKCAQNMATAIDLMPATLGVNNFDLVGFQEASRGLLLQKAAGATLDKLLPVFSKATNSEMASFYDDQQFDLAHQITSKFSDQSQDRPFQLLVLNRKGSSDGVIFINCHCPHASAANLAHPQKLTYSDFGAIAFDLGNALKTLPLTNSEKDYRIVAVGDFNETGWDWASNSVTPNHWKPFSVAGILTNISIDPTPFTNPPKDVRLRLRTCCMGDGQWTDENGKLKEGSRGGDYIFDSVAPAPAQIPSIDAKSFNLCSDHLPVVALI